MSGIKDKQYWNWPEGCEIMAKGAPAYFVGIYSSPYGVQSIVWKRHRDGNKLAITKGEHVRRPESTFYRER